jgi:hypothetical protein
MKTLKSILTLATVSALTTFAFAHEGEKHDKAKGEAKELTVKGEEHAGCAKKCINMGLQVGIKGEDGKTYLLIGDHKPLNKQLADSAAKTITVRGKFTSRDGFNMIENAEVARTTPCFARPKPTRSPAWRCTKKRA